MRVVDRAAELEAVVARTPAVRCSPDPKVLSRHHFATRDEARRVVLASCHGFYNVTRRHSSAGMLSPINFETAALRPEAA